MISFAGNVTYNKADAIRDAASKIPINSLLLETDSPYLSPQPVRGKPNTPVHITHTYEYVAGLRGIDVEKLSETVRNNLCRLFKITRPG
jgi:TatD DNase family protein